MPEVMLLPLPLQIAIAMQGSMLPTDNTHSDGEDEVDDDKQINIIIHTQKRYLEVISHSTRFKEFNRENKLQKKHRISLKLFQELGHTMLVLVLQNFARVVSLSSLYKLHFQYFRSSS
jgi:hypothetical protein